MAKIILDPGHGGREIGDYYGNRSEKNDNLRLTLKVGQFLELQGVEVVYTRTTDTYLSATERIAFINANGGDLMVSIHRLSGRNFSFTPGLDFFIKDNASSPREAAEAIGKALYPVGYTTFDIIIRTDISLLNDVSMPAVMLGIGYIETEEENEYFDRHIIPIAEGIATGILNYLMENSDDIGTMTVIPMSRSYRYRVMAGEYRNYDEAVKQQLILQRFGIHADLSGNQRRFQIVAGLTGQLDEAILLEQRLRSLGYRTMIIIV